MTYMNVAIFVLLASPDAAWVMDGRDEGVVVSRRERSDSELREFKATGMIDAPPDAVWKLLVRFGDYNKLTPFAERTEIRKAEGNVTHLYVLTNPPMISKRDYCARYTDDSATAGEGVRLLRWEISDQAPPVQDGVVRVARYEGYWKLEPRDGGQKTFATYYLFTDPGGSLPSWVINKLAGGGMRDLFVSLRGFLKSPG